MLRSMYSKKENPVHSVVFRIQKSSEGKPHVSLVDFGSPNEMVILCGKLEEARSPEAIGVVWYKLVNVADGYTVHPDDVKRDLHDYVIAYRTDGNGEPFRVDGLSQWEMVESGTDNFFTDFKAVMEKDPIYHHIATFKKNSKKEDPKIAVIFRSVYKDLEFVSSIPVWAGEESVAVQVHRILNDEVRDLPGRDRINITYTIVPCVDDTNPSNYHSDRIIPEICRTIRDDRKYTILYEINSVGIPYAVYRIDDITDWKDDAPKNANQFLSRYCNPRFLGYGGRCLDVEKTRKECFYLFNFYSRKGVRI